MITKKNVRCKNIDSRNKSIHKTLVSKILKIQRELQKKSDKKNGKNKIIISEVYASKILAGRIK